MRYESLCEPYHAGKRDFGFRDMPITVLLLQRQTLLSLLERRIFSVECMRVASNHAEHGYFDTAQIVAWGHALDAFHQFVNSELGLENLFKATERGWVEDLFGGRHKLLVDMCSVDDLLFDYDQQSPWSFTADGG